MKLFVQQVVQKPSVFSSVFGICLCLFIFAFTFAVIGLYMLCKLPVQQGVNFINICMRAFLVRVSILGSFSLGFGFEILSRPSIGAKASHKMLMK
jgi:hypothetical protein